MAENRTFRKPTLAEAVIVVLALFLPITIGNIIFGYNIILMLLVAGSLASLMAMRIGWRWKEIETSIIAFLHIVESGAGCGGHRLGTGERGARTGVDGAELILTLHELSAYLRQPFGHHL